MSKMTPALEQWTIYSAAQNLPAVLNDPNRGKQSNFFVKTWGDGFVEKTDIGKSPFLPEVNLSHFELYLRKHGKRYKRHSRLSQSKLDSTIKLQRNKNDSSRDADLSIVPEIFLKPTLPLNDAGTFNAVFPCVGIEQNAQSHQSGRLLQEKLSHYLDIVEVQIAHQVSQKSQAFFHAMTSHDTIMEQMGSACREVRLVRNRMRTVDGALSEIPLRLLGLARSRCNHTALLDKLRLMSTVLQTQPTLQLLLSGSDFVAALELIASTQQVLGRELAGVTSLRHLPSQLREMTVLIDKMLRAEFQRYAEVDLHRPLDATGVLEPERLTSLVAGLLRENNLHFLDVYRQEAMTAAQTVLKQLTIEQMAQCERDSQVTGSSDVPLTHLEPAQWLRLLGSAADALGHLALRVKDVHDVIQSTSDLSAGQTSGDLVNDLTENFLSVEEHKNVADKLKALLTSVCDYFHERLANMVSTHSGTDVTSVQLTQLANVVDEFGLLCQEVCGQQSTALKVSFNIQASRYVVRFHHQRRSKLSLLLEAERWKAADVPSGFQRLLDGLVEGDTAEIEGVGDVTEPGADEEVSDALRVVTQRYVAVGAVLMLLRLVSEYCWCAQELPSQALYVGRNLCDLLKLFNSRTCQLVLGAQALKLAGLKTITSTNLALASRALQLVQWLVPYVRTHFHKLGAEDLPQLDVVESELAYHVRDIEAKVLSIMNSLLGEQLNEWEARPPVPSKAFRNISRHLTKLHEAVSTVLPQEQISQLYALVHKNFKDCLREHLSKMNIINNGGPQHGVVTSELTFYLETMRNLKVLQEMDMSDKAMEDIWNKKI